MVCPVFRVDGREVLTARGKMHLLTTALAEQPSAVFEDRFSRCLLCGACEQVCPRQLPITALISQARSTFSRFYGPNGLTKAAACAALTHPALFEGLVKAGISLQRLQALPVQSGLRLKLNLLEQRIDETAGGAPYALRQGLDALWLLPAGAADGPDLVPARRHAARRNRRPGQETHRHTQRHGRIDKPWLEPLTA